MEMSLDAFCWNPPDADGKPKLSRDVDGGYSVRATDYMEVSNLLGTTGCSAQSPYWDWSVLGITSTDRGPQVVYPGDWVVTLGIKVIGVFDDRTYHQFYGHIKPSNNLPYTVPSDTTF